MWQRGRFHDGVIQNAPATMMGAFVFQKLLTNRFRNHYIHKRLKSYAQVYVRAGVHLSTWLISCLM